MFKGLRKYAKEVNAIYDDAYAREASLAGFAEHTAIPALNALVMFLAPIYPLARYLERKLILERDKPAR